MVFAIDCFYGKERGMERGGSNKASMDLGGWRRRSERRDGAVYL